MGFFDDIFGGVSDFFDDITFGVFGDTQDFVADILGIEELASPDTQRSEAEKEIRKRLKEEQARLKDALNSANAKERLAAEKQMELLTAESNKEISRIKAAGLKERQEGEAEHAQKMQDIQIKDDVKEKPTTFDREKYLKSRRRAESLGPLRSPRNVPNQTRPGSIIPPRNKTERRPQ
tara:strand:- start:2897 stop:3430 length:534 start_codon:yes stop_codon:yes gene_type:complete